MEFIRNAELESADVLFDWNAGREFASNKSSIILKDVEVNTANPIVRVELRDMQDNVIAEMANIGGNKYKAAAPLNHTGTIEVKTTSPIEIDAGYFEWFRDPNKKVWMYDFIPYGETTATRYHVSTRPGEFEQPPNSSQMPNGCIAATSPTDITATARIPCNEGPAYRTGNLHISTLTVVGSGEPVSISDVDNLNFDDDFTFVQVGRLTQANIKDLHTDFIDKETQDYRFTFTAVYDTSPDLVPSDDANGRVLRWYNKWKMNVVGNIYKYPKMKVVAITLPPEAKPDLTATNLSTPQPCIEAGSSTTFNYQITNQGPSTSAAFNVTVMTEGTEVATHRFPSGIGANEVKNRTFNYTFSSAKTKSFSVIVDSESEIEEEDESNTSNGKIVTFEAVNSCGPPEAPAPPPKDITIEGDFTLSKTTVDWGSGVFAQPEGIEVTGCSYVWHAFSYKQGENTYNAPPLTQKTNSDVFSYDPNVRGYAAGIGLGTVQVYMTINTDCGHYVVVGPKNLQLVADPNNLPPQIEIKWFRGTEPVSTVVEGDVVAIKVTDESDPNGDPIQRTWDFTKDAWTSSLPATYDWDIPLDRERYGGIVANVTGLHQVCVTARDTQGAGSGAACATLKVEGKEPIPVIKGPTIVKEGRKLIPALHSNDSYSNIPGRTIHHSRDEWTNYSGPNQVFSTAGTQVVELHVYDNTGLKSISPDRHTITVIPDMPPKIEFEYLSTMTRIARQFKNASYSPDGDRIEQYKVTFGYDRYNNGGCNALESLISTDNNYFTFQPDRVGNYCFRVYAKEAVIDGGGGKDAYQDYMVHVINEAPEVSFTVTGAATEPMPVNVSPFHPNDFMHWTNSSLDTPWMLNSWSATADGRLISARRGADWNTISKFSLPIGAANFNLNKQEIPMPTQSAVVEHELGNGEFITSSVHSGDIRKMFLVGMNHEPIYLGFNVATFSVRPELDEILFYETYGPNPLGNYIVYREKWYRLKISDLVNRVTTNIASGNYEIKYSTTMGSWTQTGTKMQYGNGDRPNRFSRLKFNSDYKEINMTTRTIKSFHPNELYPYKIETYSHLPALPKNTQCPDSCSYAGLPMKDYPSGYDELLGPMSGWLDSDQPYVPIDAKGNYYNIMNLNGSSTLVRWDANTGMPTVLRPIVAAASGEIKLAGVSADAKYARYSNHDGYGSTDVYQDLATGSTMTNRPADYQVFLEDKAHSYQNGYAVKRNPADPYFLQYHLYDQGSHIELTDGTNALPVPHEIKFLNDTKYVGATGQTPVGGSYRYWAPLYSYIPSTSQTVHSNEAITFGQLVNPWSHNITNGTVAWNMQFQELKYSNFHAGMGFRIQDHKNMYRVEANKNYLQLVKIMGGRKTVIAQVNRRIQAEKWYGYKIRLVADRIRIYEEGALVIDVHDGTFTQGTMGPYSVADNTEFKGMNYQSNSADASYLTPGVAIVDTDVIYTTDYRDAEGDPKIDNRAQWTYHLVDGYKFLDAGDGKSIASAGPSALENQTVVSTYPQFDRVGVFKIDYRVPDDPHPEHRIAAGDNTFGAYSEYSDLYSQHLIVHRIPIANFALGLDGNSVVTWTDHSYDPDRCHNTGSCMGGYESTHGIMRKKFYYITPTGNRVDAKLVRPTEAGTYTVAMAVADEYNAWSDWYEQTVVISSVPPPNTPPTVHLTFPGGTHGNPSPVSLQPTITWNQNDVDRGTIFSTFDLNIKDEWGGCTECLTNMLMDTPNTTWAWTMDHPLTMGRKYQVQVRSTDGESWSPWSNVGWMATNTPPSAYMTFPYGTQAEPNVVNTLRPTLTWSQTDPDPSARFDYFQIQITNEANSVTIVDSGRLWQGTTTTSGSWAVPADLPTGQKLRVRVIVWDEHGAASNWSPQTWMLINQPPRADFTWSPNPAFEGDTVILLNRSSDPDGDSFTSHWQIHGPDYQSDQTAYDALIPSSATDFHPGDYTVTLTVSDVHGAADTVTKIVQVGDLQVQGFVRHTEQWELNRQAYNLDLTGDPDRPRSADMFWSGEAFVVEAITNEPAGRVQAAMIDTGIKIPLGSGNNKDWSGQIFRDDFEKLPDASYIFRFTAVWASGHTETADTVISVQNPWTEFTSSVRKE
ncbi:CARDB domain-containing protein [Paenibacillus xerothermodurans]|uniref:CARDB domain-containing protein n=1 Tax=Paenibacillus xerothermodurans TaxID=1977292 RepID=UPI00140200B5|nr:CARDB domain-containing protein [Paenibacillus xerothermodurans]